MNEKARNIKIQFMMVFVVDENREDHLEKLKKMADEALNEEYEKVVRRFAAELMAMVLDKLDKQKISALKALLIRILHRFMECQVEYLSEVEEHE